MFNNIRLLFLFFFASIIVTQGRAADILLSDQAKFSVITCTPGPDLYSLFGHSAIRFQDNINGQIIDWVYNYGTFEFDDSFYWKFSMGKLDYLLSKEDFPYFQHSYIMEGRGIFEQDLLLSSTEKQKLFDLLEENYLPQNRTYRYDFFYDNCSTRIRDIIKKALDNKVDFTYSYSKERTFRQAIQSYLDYQPWSDLGIDIALGMPCDRTVGKEQMMFLPDSLMQEMKFASRNSQPISPYAQDILPTDYELSNSAFLTPIVLFFLFLILHLGLGFLFLSKGKVLQLTDRALFLITGLTGIMIVFLWFLTDHTATAWNLNILWANPLNILFAFTSSKKLNRWKKKYLIIYMITLILTLTFWFVLPQRLHFSIIALVLALVFTCIKMLRPQFLSKSIVSGSI